MSAVDLTPVTTVDRLLVALDFDGTLSPLVDEPMTARMSAAARAAVERLVEAPGTIVALVSGRSLRDLRIIAEHEDSSRILLAGSHGAEFWTPDRGVVTHPEDAATGALRAELQRRAEEATAGMRGVWIEPKTFGLGVHTRAADPATEEEARRRVDGLVAEAAPHWRRRTGHNIVEYAFRSEGKDSAVAELRAWTRADAVVFAGDDVTDEDALRSLSGGDLGIHVGDRESAATLKVPDIDALADVLLRLATERVARAQ